MAVNYVCSSSSGGGGDRQWSVCIHIFVVYVWWPGGVTQLY